MNPACRKWLRLPGAVAAHEKTLTRQGKALLGGKQRSSRPRNSSLRVNVYYDHKHRHVADKGVPYEFKDAYQLMAAFFTEVDRVLMEAKQ